MRPQRDKPLIDHNHTSAMTTLNLQRPSLRFGRLDFFTTILAACLLAMASNACAQSEKEVGSFTRSDGARVSAFEKDHGRSKYHYTRCWFVLPDGSTLDVSQNGQGSVEQNKPQQRRYQACAIRTLDTAAEIYRYPSTRLPVAASVQQFDGYAFADVTTAGKRWLSPLLHFSRRWPGYLLCLILLLPFLFLETMIVRRTCGRGWWRTLRRMTIGAAVGFVGFYILMTTLFGPYSPLIYALLVGAGILFYRGTRKALRL